MKPEIYIPPLKEHYSKTSTL